MTRGGAPLDGDTFASTGKHESHEHFLKVVRTTFRPLSRDIVDMCTRPARHAPPRPPRTARVARVPARPLTSVRHACRYHFTTSAATHTTQQGGVPAVTFTYDLSPMQAIIAWLGLGLNYRVRVRARVSG